MKIKKLGNLKFRTKIEAFGIAVCFLFIALNSVFANTVTINDTGISDDSGELFNFTSGLLSFGNGTCSGNVSAGNVSVSGDYVGGNVANWDTAYGWGDHSGEGYLLSNGDPYFNASDAFGFTWTMAAGWNSSGSGDFETTKIMNSNGNNWTATEANLQVAIDDLTSGNGTVWLPPCDLTITSTIYINNTGVKIIGQGAGFWEYDHGATKLKLGFSGEMFNVTNALHGDGHGSGVTFEGIKFYADDHTTFQGDCIVVSDLHNLQVINCGFSNINGTCVKFVDKCYSSSIVECDFINCGPTDAGTIYYGTDITAAIVKECVIENDYYIAIQDAGGTYCAISDNSFEGQGDSPRIATIYGSFLESCITNNNFGYNGDATAINITGDKVVITNNVIQQYGTGIYVQTGADYCIVSNNEFIETGGIGVFTDGAKTKIENNQFISGGSSSPAIKSTHTFVSIGGNTITNWDDTGILLDDANHNIIWNNVLQNFSNMDTGIYCHDANDIIIANNRIVTCNHSIDLDNSNVLRPFIVSNNWQGCTVDCIVDNTNSPRIMGNIDKDGDWWVQGSVEFNNVTAGNLTVDDKIIMSNGGVTWNIYVNATGVLKWEME